MPSLSERLVNSFPINSRRIAETINLDTIEVIDTGPDIYVTQISGYEVQLLYEQNWLDASCTCEWFEVHHQGCRHLWASILLADRQGALDEARTAPTLDIAFDEDNLLSGPDDDFKDYDDLDQDDDEMDFIESFGTRYRAFPSKTKKKAPKTPKAPEWLKFLDPLKRNPTSHFEQRDAWPSQRQLVYIIDLAGLYHRVDGLRIQIEFCEPKRNGELGKPRRGSINRNQLASVPDPLDRQILAMLAGASTDEFSAYSYGTLAQQFAPSTTQAEMLLPLLTQTKRFFYRTQYGADDLTPVQFDDGPPWNFSLVVTPQGSKLHVFGELQRGDETMSLTTPKLLVKGFLLANDRLSRLDDHGAFPWLMQFRKQPRIDVPRADQDRFLQEMMQCPVVPPMRLPPELMYETVAPAPRFCLKLKPEVATGYRNANKGKLQAEVTFDYDGLRVAHHDRKQGVFQAKERRLVRRDPAQEKIALDFLAQLGFKSVQYFWHPTPTFLLAASALPKIMNLLLEAGWLVEAEGKVYRQAGSFHIDVQSGIDWFELHGGMKFDDQEVALPDILKAIKDGSNLVKLGDGTFGMLPEQWLKKYGLLTGLGKTEEDHLRFGKSQVGLLDALLATQPEASFDAVFSQARDELRRFEGIQAAEPPAEFKGQLRPYQNEGLGWLLFLQRFGFGGCLADDMGLGKTVQILALLAGRRTAKSKKDKRPSLVVVPKSLIFNWLQESTKFAPDLRVLDHTGLARTKTTEAFADYDLILTTYGILRRDALLFKEVEFDLCILDEAQAVKNAQSESAKAVRLLHSQHRLALSGTPIENHLGELWSLFEFLNPGMLGQASVFKMTAGASRTSDPETRALLAKALKPFILRRTKEQVAKDLPKKTEQTLFCDLEPEQRKIYNELRDYYRQSLLGKIEKEGLKKSKILVLEALLRLRQAACHPALINQKYTDVDSAKLDILMPQLREVFDGGHKVLVFSQFTSFLALVRKRLDADKVPYEYLDGKTRDRAAKVERFQNDPDCKLFLISLKAGGLGLNLTAAEYVFLLDPWWNPAVEAQAIDRAHRIGQERPVFAYRLIARDTVEEKVLELQKNKRELADAILNADNRLLADLSREDLELLLT